MKASELRIGNLVFAPALKSVRVIDCLDIRDFFEGRLYRSFEGIPLTSEWLWKFGFRQQGNRKMWVRDKVAVVWHEGHMFNDDGYYVAFKDMGNVIYHTQCCVEFVHQLQNAYFLTGEELTIKDEVNKK